LKLREWVVVVRHLDQADFFGVGVVGRLHLGKTLWLRLGAIVELERVGLVSVFGIPPNNRVANAFVLAPILPALFRGGWSLVTRTVIPAVVTVPVGTDRRTGFGDITSEVLGHKLFKGRKNQFYDIGWGPFVGFPSASDDFLGTGRWRLGPELVLGISARKWVTVLVVRNEWSVGSNNTRADVNTLVLDYLLFTLVFWKPNPVVFAID